MIVLSKFLKLSILLFIFLMIANLSRYQQEQAVKLQLRSNYVKSLLNFEGHAYAPYGEPGGISCSTLVRQALINTVGIDQLTRSAVIAHPCQSDELRKGCEGQLKVILQAANIKSIDYSQLQEGDIAIIGNQTGLHTMAYIGNKKWIHSDPINEKVVETYEPDENDDWVTFNATVMRWKALQD